MNREARMEQLRSSLPLFQKGVTMQIVSSPPKDNPLGIYIHFSLSATDAFQRKVTPKGTYRWDVAIALPRCQKDKWLEGVNVILRKIQNGNTWTVRLDYANAIQFFTLHQLHQLDDSHAGTQFWLYNTPENVRDGTPPNAVKFLPGKKRSQNRRCA